MLENSKNIQAEELQCKAMAENAQRELDKSMPALEEALKVDVCLVFLTAGILELSSHLPFFISPLTLRLWSLSIKRT